MAYFESICTKGMVPNFESAARAHKDALNAYLLIPGPSGKKREVEKMSSVQSLRNEQEIITTTFLCCDEDNDD